MSSNLLQARAPGSMMTLFVQLSCPLVIASIPKVVTLVCGFGLLGRRQKKLSELSNSKDPMTRTNREVYQGKKTVKSKP